MQPLENRTPFAANYHIMPNEQGQDAVFVIVKACFMIGRSWTLAEPQPEPVEDELYWGEPGQSSVRLASDIHLPKPGTDIVIHAHARAPEGKPVRALDVRARVGQRERTLRVWGNRVWQSGSISPPEPFEALPIRYELAYGGHQVGTDGRPVTFPKNPIGRGFHPEASAQALDGTWLPNIENPEQLIRQPEDQPSPAGFGFIAPYWEPRASRAGTYDERWQRDRAPYAPLDYQPEFQHAAHPDWTYDGFLLGGEPVLLENLHPKGPLTFQLPTVKLRGRVSFSGLPERALDFAMDTLLMDIDQQSLTMTWQAHCVCNNDLHRLRSVSVGLKR